MVDLKNGFQLDERERLLRYNNLSCTITRDNVALIQLIVKLLADGQDHVLLDELLSKLKTNIMAFKKSISRLDKIMKKAGMEPLFIIEKHPDRISLSKRSLKYDFIVGDWHGFHFTRKGNNKELVHSLITIKKNKESESIINIYGYDKNFKLDGNTNLYNIEGLISTSHDFLSYIGIDNNITQESYSTSIFDLSEYFNFPKYRFGYIKGCIYVKSYEREPLLSSFMIRKKKMEDDHINDEEKSYIITELQRIENELCWGVGKPLKVEGFPIE